MKSKNVFNVYRLLIGSYKSEKEVSAILGIKTPTFYKYLNLLKKTGFEANKDRETYSILSFNHSIKLSPAEKTVLAYLMFLSYSIFPSKRSKTFYKIADKILKMSDKKTYLEVYDKFEKIKLDEKNKTYFEKIEVFEKYKNLSVPVTVNLKNGKELYLIPAGVVYKNKRIYFDFLDSKKDEKKLINLDKIIKLTPRSVSMMPVYNAKDTVFELYGRLAKTYLLKDGERIVDNFSDRIVVANQTSDKELLFKRLLKYDTLCKVRFPKEDVQRFKKLIEKSLENIQNIKDNIKQAGRN